MQPFQKDNRARPSGDSSAIKTKILIVEDEPLNLQVMTRYIGLLGYRVLHADTGEKGLRLALEENPAAIVLDNNLPDMTGLDICRTLRRENIQTPVILMSAYELPPDELKEARVLGIRGFLKKPFAFQHLKGVLRIALKKTPLHFFRKKFFYRNPHYSLSSKSLAQKIFQTIFREGLDVNGHVHFHIDGHEDHIILLCDRKHLGKMIAKSPECEQGECIKWDQSSFAHLAPDAALKDLNQKISQVRIDAADYQMAWPTLADFICWLEFSY